MFKIKIIFMCW